mmetsp:Transcript_36569/g.32790  ORF Transcript_36569/g.32790 Transcript_36569/m.32790 type:complete len:106 (+) Transcript_36569:768-1085(+)
MFIQNFAILCATFEAIAGILIIMWGMSYYSDKKRSFRKVRDERKKEFKQRGIDFSLFYLPENDLDDGICYLKIWKLYMYCEFNVEEDYAIEFRDSEASGLMHKYD